VPRRRKHPLLTSHTRCAPFIETKYMSSKPIWKRQPNKGYEINHSTYGQVIICNRNKGNCSESKICQTMTFHLKWNFILFLKVSSKHEPKYFPIGLYKHTGTYIRPVEATIKVIKCKLLRYQVDAADVYFDKISQAEKIGNPW
jgi:hypothetical protein